METVEINGHKYRAIEAPVVGECGNCAFKKGFGCLLAEAKGEALSYCSGKHRPDGKDMNFIPAHLA
jgi:hypothetical protein